MSELERCEARRQKDNKLKKQTKQTNIKWSIQTENFV